MYSYKKGIGKVIKYGIIYLLPQLVDKFLISFPEIGQLTVAAVLIFLVNLLKVKYGVRVLG